MKVAIVIRRFGPRLGGAELWTWRFCHWLAKRGHEVHVIAKEAQGKGPFTVHRASLAFHRHAERLAHRLQPDIIHDMGYIRRADLVHPHSGTPRGRLMRRRTGFARLVGHYSISYRRYWRLLRQQVAHRAGRFLAVSGMVAEDLQRWHGVAPARIHTIPNGVDLERFRPVNKPKEGPFQLLFVGSNPRLKGLETLLRALGQLQSCGGDWSLHVVGCRPKRRWARLARSVTFEAYTPHIERCYSQADCFVLPTTYDSCSLSVLEALACGLPVITTTRNGVVEFVGNHPSCHVLDDPTDVDQLVSLLQKVRAAPNFGRPPGLVSLTENFQAVEALYQKILLDKTTALNRARHGRTK